MRLAAFFLVVTGFAAAGQVEAQVGTNKNLSDPNLADRAALRMLPHVSDALADAIVGRSRPQRR